MPAFAYTARTPQGELKSATIEASSKDDAVAQLRKMRMNVVKVEEQSKTTNKTKGAIGMRDIVIFTRQFSTMINAGLPLVQSRHNNRRSRRCRPIRRKPKHNWDLLAVLVRKRESLRPDRHWCGAAAPPGLACNIERL